MIKVALDHASVESSVKDIEVELDYDDGKWIYKVEFDVNQWEYIMKLMHSHIKFYQ